MEERENLIELYEIYKDLLTEKQRKYFEYYYYEDLSLNEISDKIGVSKSFVSKMINNTVNKLNNYESILSVNLKEKKLLNLLNNIKDDKIKNVIEEILYK